METLAVVGALPTALRMGCERDLAVLLRLAEKIQRGGHETVTTRELAALRRVEKQQQDAARELLAGALPKKDWVLWSGRPHQVLADQAERYGIPLSGETISVRAVARWIHDFLAEHGSRLRNGNGRGDAEIDPLMLVGDGPALERYRTAQAAIRELQLAQMKGELLDRGAVHALHVRMADVLRKAGEQILRSYGEGPHEILASALDSLEREMKASRDQP